MNNIRKGQAIYEATHHVPAVSWAFAPSSHVQNFFEKIFLHLILLSAFGWHLGWLDLVIAFVSV